MADVVRDDNVQHGIDDDPTSDAEKGATLGGIGGAVTGAIAGSLAGPGGAVVGAVIGGVAGAVASGAAVGAIDRVDNDNNISGVGDGMTRDVEDTAYDASIAPGNGIPGVQTGGRLADGSTDTRGIMEKTADAVTGDNWDDKQGKPVDPMYPNRASISDPAYAATPNRTWDTAAPGNGIPGVQTGGHAADGTPDTRGIMEKTADAVTGDNIDDKTGKRVP
jgi:hypothetical protein